MHPFSLWCVTSFFNGLNLVKEYAYMNEPSTVFRKLVDWCFSRTLKLINDVSNITEARHFTGWYSCNLCMKVNLCMWWFMQARFMWHHNLRVLTGVHWRVLQIILCHSYVSHDKWCKKICISKIFLLVIKNLRLTYFQVSWVWENYFLTCSV